MDEGDGVRGFRGICLGVAGLYGVLGGLMLVQGAAGVMPAYGVPDDVVALAHYQDFFHFTFVHMVTIGVLIGLLGVYVRERHAQVAIARVMCLLQAHYVYLDLRTADWTFGSALYKGTQSLGPAIIGIAVLLAFGYVATRSARPTA